MKIFKDFDFSLLNDPGFKEDAVREELVTPLLNKLSYSASGPNKIQRSWRLKHPFVHIGTRSTAVTMIPDYTLIVDSKPRWILDAKSPTEMLVSGKNPEQAYSYAIHPEIDVNRYALCNGHILVVFDLNKREPVLNVSLKKINQSWREVKRLLSPLAFTNPALLNYNPDFGMFLLKTGAVPGTKFVFSPMGLPMIGKRTAGEYTIVVSIQFERKWLAATFDFDEQRFEQLVASLPDGKFDQIKEQLSNYPFHVIFDNNAPEVCIEAIVGADIVSNTNEVHCPLIVEKFSAA